jgi:hypothetical protein
MAKKAPTKAKLRTLVGIVTPVEWDEDDAPTAVCIETDDDERYYVYPKEQGHALLDKVDMRVEAKGVIEDEDDEPHILVKEFIELEDDIDDEDDDDGFEDDDEDEDEDDRF